MIQADKIKIIQHLQLLHSEWLLNYSNALAIGSCVDFWTAANKTVSNLIEVVYRYKPFDSAVTNADEILISIADTDPLEQYTIDISYGVTSIGSYVGTGTEAEVRIALCDSINANTDTHNYICLEVGDSLFVYTMDVGASYSDVPTLTFSELDTDTVELQITYSELSLHELGSILDAQNCITVDQLCTIINKIKTILNKKNCN